ncbi:MAG: hypothetical protein KDJ37_03050 [Hyphomicrobiaceae bacterium]|nr:hypothetical protein [Hyphomicrobiaceae bacterium]
MSDKRMPADFRADAATLRAWALAPVDTAHDLVRNLNGLYQTLGTLELGRYDVHEIAAAAPRLIHALFETRMLLKERLADWHAQGFLSREVQRGLRDAFRIMRYGSDMLGELAINHRRLPTDARTLRGFRGTDTNTLINPRFVTGADIPFQSGDVVLMRGRAHNSAAIARIGDIDSQYSHAGIVYVDPKGLHWMVEVLIEKGGVIMPLERALSEGLGRAIVFRHRDTALAQRAAYIAHEHVKQSLSRYGKPILYDFSMELDGYKRLYCSKLVRMAYLQASEGAASVPTFATRLDMKNRDFFERIGVTASETFAPGDLELEPGFDTVAEWQDYRVTAEMRLGDLVMDKLFEWMDAHDLRFKENFIIGLISRLGRFAAGLSGTAKSIVEEVVPTAPAHMPRKTIAAIVMLHKTAGPLVDELMQIERERIQVFGYALHPREVLEYLERRRQQLGNEIGYLTPAAR